MIKVMTTFGSISDLHPQLPGSETGGQLAIIDNKCGIRRICVVVEDAKLIDMFSLITRRDVLYL